MIRLVGTIPDWVLAGDAYEDHHGGAVRVRDAAALLATPITSAAHVAAWTDSIFNASLPLPSAAHTGVLPTGARYRHHPKPIRTRGTSTS